MKTEIYIHIPFCVKKCNYCDFLSFSMNESDRELYVAALIEQIKHRALSANEHDKALVVSSIYVGGGTPSLLSSHQLHRIMSTIYECFDVEDICENTIEVNPGTLDLCKLKEIYAIGFNRISIGMQSTFDDELKMLGRIHTYEEFTQCYVNTRKAGFNNVNIDVMVALPGQSNDRVMSTIRRVIDFEPEHISAYSLIIEEGTNFYDKYGDIEGPVVGSTVERRMYWDSTDILVASGYRHYEISNYSKSSFESKHNCGYWKRVPYVGIGLGASSLQRGVLIDNRQDSKLDMRIRNTTDINEYIENPNKVEENIIISFEEAMDEYVFLGLRMSDGININDFENTFGINIYDRYGTIIDKYVREELIDVSDNKMKLTRKGIDYGNYVFSGFML